MTLPVQSVDWIQPPRVLVYGVEGIGKTTFASTCPKPIFLFSEDGRGKLRGLHYFGDDPKDPRIVCWDHLLAAIKMLRDEEHNYQTCVVDTVDGFVPALFAHVCGIHGKEDIEAFGYGKGYVVAADAFRELIWILDELRNAKRMMILLLAHSEIRTYSPPDNDSYDRYYIRMHQKLVPIMTDWADAVLFAHNATATRTEKGSGKDDSKRRLVIGEGRRVMITSERPFCVAKNRYALPPEMPFEWSALEQHIFGEE